MKTESVRQMSDSFLPGALLAVTGGFLDIYSYLLRGKVFANAQTGNMVLFGLRLADGAFLEALSYLIPIGAFVAGVLAAEWIRKRLSVREKPHWRQAVIGLETVLLFGIAFVPSGQWDFAVNAILSFVCAMQVEAFRKFEGGPFATTMCTGNLRSASELAYRFSIKKDREDLKKSLQYFAVIGIFIGGVLLGAFCAQLLGVKSIFVCCLLLAAVFGLLCKKEAL